MPYDAFWNWDDLEGQPVNATHKALRTKLRAFMDTEIAPHVADWEEQGGFPQELHTKAYACGVYGVGWPKEYGGQDPTAEDMDHYHRFINSDELGRVAAGGIWASLFTHSIGLGPILALGTDEQKAAYARAIISGEKKVCLAITESSGGSDVANCATTAVRDGDHFIVNGVKMFISGGMHADYFTTAVRAGGPGLDGVSLLLIHRETPGLKTKRLP